MAKHLNVNLALTADSSKAKAELQNLKKTLDDLSKGSSILDSKLGVTKEIQEATSAAAQLKTQLELATDVNTGKLDLSKFSAGLKQSGVNLEDYQKSLSNLGAAGDKAFASLADSVLSADAPLRQVSSRLSEMKTTLANAARWQISSSILHL